MKLISVLIPHYNTDTLRNAVTSALSQSYPNIEVIVCDDGSDKIPCLRDLDVKLIKNEVNIGHGKTVDRLISEANGEFFSILDADDTYNSAIVLEELYKNITDKDYVYGDFVLVGMEGMWKYQEYDINEIPKIILNRRGSGVIPFNHGLHRKSFWVDNNLKLELRCAGDTLACIKACEAGMRMKHIDMPMTNYKYGGGISSTPEREKGVSTVMSYLNKYHGGYDLSSLTD